MIATRRSTVSRRVEETLEVDSSMEILVVTIGEDDYAIEDADGTLAITCISSSARSSLWAHCPRPNTLHVRSVGL